MKQVMRERLGQERVQGSKYCLRWIVQGLLFLKDCKLQKVGALSTAISQVPEHNRCSKNI